MKRLLSLSFVLVLVLGACSSAPAAEEAASESGPGSMMMGGHSTTMSFHHAEVPDAYVGMKSSVEADAESIARGMDVYTLTCAVCHGDGGMGDGPAGAALDPSPAPVAHTSQMMGDGYLFWRVSEGGVDEGTGMAAYKAILSEEEIWDVINYIRALGSGDVMPPENGVGGAAYDPAAERANHESMLAEALSQDLIDTDQSNNFMLVHDALDAYILENDISPGSEGIGGQQDEIFAALVEAGTLTQEQVDSFNEVHELLLDEGLMN
ncbi:MAG: cytochrome c [Anaerolineae bacterium]|jgi:mono/diheme cytochrome c family protein|nr:cytochrome c [Anaerolineae bacterium]MBT3713327.1 cytochrome c [Anaerolineae bacterium]MBT4310602.1 cytochrome c [Anaerolineae bacterium]MBT4459005.1 cytochrome c [Anaerolineae bacterium]MBT4842605.1 cytochrome c [Anaerolineae bacterium]